MDHTKLLAEFPSYPVDTLPAIPEHWIPQHWRNEACPSWQADPTEGKGVYVYVDYPNPVDREWPDSTQFTIHESDRIICVDTWPEVLKAVEELSQ
jgi:hypothetical protein